MAKHKQTVSGSEVAEVPATFKDAAGGSVAVVSANMGLTVDASKFALIADPAALEALKYNLQGEQISEFDLDRIKVPAGGGLMWQTQTLEGIKSVESLEGIMLSVSVRKGYWESVAITFTPPDCYSLDGLKGVGNPGGECSGCPFNEFGSAIKADGSQGNGKRCKERRMILFLRAEDRLPIAVFAPAASIKPIKQFLMKLPVASYRAVVSLKLVQEKNGDGITFSKIQPSYLGHIDEAAGRSMLGYVKSLTASLNASVSAEDFSEPQGEST